MAAYDLMVKTQPGSLKNNKQEKNIGKRLDKFGGMQYTSIQTYSLEQKQTIEEKVMTSTKAYHPP